MKYRSSLICFANIVIIGLLLLLVYVNMQRFGSQWMLRPPNFYISTLIILVFLNAVYKLFFIYRREKKNGGATLSDEAYETILDKEKIEERLPKNKTPLLFKLSLTFQMLVLIAGIILFSGGFDRLQYKMSSLVFLVCLGISEIMTILYLQKKE